MVAVPETLFRPKTPDLGESQKLQQMERQIESLKQELAQKAEVKAAPKAKPKPAVTAKDLNTFVKPHDRDKPLSSDDTKKLISLVQTQLKPEQLQGMIEIIRDEQNIDNNGKEFTFDLNKLPARKQREIEAYVKKCLLGATPKKGIQPRSSTGQPLRGSAGSSTSASGIRSGQLVSSNQAPQPQQRLVGLSSSSSSSSSDNADMGQKPPF